MAYWRQMASSILVIIGSGNYLLPGGTKWKPFVNWTLWWDPKLWLPFQKIYLTMSSAKWQSVIIYWPQFVKLFVFSTWGYTDWYIVFRHNVIMLTIVFFKGLQIKRNHSMFSENLKGSWAILLQRSDVATSLSANYGAAFKESCTPID